MRKFLYYLWLFIGLVVLFILSCIGPGGQDQPDEASAHPDTIRPVNQKNVFVEPNSGMVMIKHEFLVKFIDHVRESEVEGILERVNGDVVGGIKDIAVYHIRIRDVPDDEEIWDTVTGLLSNGLIQFAMPIYRIGVHTVPDTDPIWDDWDSENPGGNNWALEMINAPEGWEYTTGSSDVNIAVVDFGFDAEHEDLIDNIGSWIDSGMDTSLFSDHGTMVSSIIAASGNNGIGMTGMMWDANLMLYESSPWSHSLFYNILDAAASGARVINLSAGLNWISSLGRAPDEDDVYDKLLTWYFSVFLDMVLHKISTAPYDVLFVQSAGNDHIDAKWNLGVELVEKYAQNYLVVAAVNQEGQLYEHSNYGDLVTVAAPGVDVLAGISQDGYDAAYTGTSCAAPFVTGLAGLLLSMKPDLSAAELTNLIVEGATQTDMLVDGSPQTLGIINVERSLELLVAAQL